MCRQYLTPMFDLAGRLKAQIKVIMNEHEQEKTTSNNRHGDHRGTS